MGAAANVRVSDSRETGGADERNVPARSTPRSLSRLPRIAYDEAVTFTIGSRFVRHVTRVTTFELRLETRNDGDPKCNEKRRR